MRDRLEQELVGFQAAGDPRRHFCAVYLRTTEAFGAAMDAGRFLDADWVERWDVAFAQLYFDALDQVAACRPPRLPWEVAFGAALGRPDLDPLRHLLLGMNAHINYDLPQALLAVIRDEDFDDPALLGRRQIDHRTSDHVLASRVEGEDRALGDDMPRTRLDATLAPVNRLGSKRFLRESREKVWHNTRLLSLARRAGPEPYARRLAQLERRTAAQQERLVAPGQVLLRLTVHGFGVRL